MQVRCFILTLFSCCFSLFTWTTIKKNPDNNMYVISAPKKTNKTILISYQLFVQKQAQIWIKNSNTYANVDAISILDGEACVFFIIRKFVEIRCRRKLNIFSRSNQNTSQRNTPFNNENVHDRGKIYSENVIIFHMHVDVLAFQVRWTKVETRHFSRISRKSWTEHKWFWNAFCHFRIYSTNTFMIIWPSLEECIKYVLWDSCFYIFS